MFSRFETYKEKLAFALVNSLTVLRVLLTCLFLFLLAQQEMNLMFYLFLFVVIVLTDFLDGRLSRYWKVQSTLGAFFDITADAFFVLGVNAFLVYQHRLPWWMLALMFFKFLEFLVSSFGKRKIGLTCEKMKRSPLLFFDVLGLFVVAGFYSLPLVLLVFSPSFYLLYFYYFLFFGALVSSIFRLYKLCSFYRKNI